MEIYIIDYIAMLFSVLQVYNSCQSFSNLGCINPPDVTQPLAVRSVE